jgi:hypothetical protein
VGLLALGALGLVLRTDAAEGACPAGQYFEVPLGDASVCDCAGSACRQGCRTYQCSTGALVGWAAGEAPQCPPYPSCGTACGVPAAECVELCANGSDDDGDGIADDGCETWPASACTVPAGCAASDGTSLSRGTVVLREPADWALGRVGLPLVFAHTYRSRRWRPWAARAANWTVLGPGWSSSLMQRPLVW